VKRALLGTSWKMNKTLAEAEAYVAHLKKALRRSDRYQVFIVPPFTHLWRMKELLRKTPILLGAQNMHWEPEGPFTGEISPKMLAEIGVDIVELGHSERRAYFNETDFTVNKKVLAALAHDLTPLVCVGERKDEKDFGAAREVVGRQVRIALHGVNAVTCERVWIAYEPVWAIGVDGIPAEPVYASELQSHIRTTVTELFGETQGSKVPILYGGSVSLQNAAELVRQPNVDGLFVGRAAWEAESFVGIINAVGRSLAET
jgi:triosephosphate isomerase